MKACSRITLPILAALLVLGSCQSLALALGGTVLPDDYTGYYRLGPGSFRDKTDPVLSGTRDLDYGAYELSPLERRALVGIFGRQTADWVRDHITVASERFFTHERHMSEGTAAYYSGRDARIRLRMEHWSTKRNLHRFATIMHEAAHRWEFTKYRKPKPVDYSSASTREIYRIPETWVGLNIEQEAELVSIYGILKYVFSDDSQVWYQYGTPYTRDDLPRFEEYLQREMYFRF